MLSNLFNPDVKLMTEKKYLYLVQTDGQLLPQYQDISSVESDVMYLCWKQPKYGMVYLPDSSWTQGRNHLLKISKTAHHRYQYYIFIDDDIEFVQGNWREFERYLSQYQPAIATPHYLEYGVQYATDGEAISPYEFDACFNAFHQDVVFDNLVLPYIEHFDSISWHFSQLVLIHLAKILYNNAVVQFNSIKIHNQKHRNYPRNIGSYFDPNWLFQEIFKDISLTKNRYKPFLVPGYEAPMISHPCQGSYQFTFQQLQYLLQHNGDQFNLFNYNHATPVLEQIMTMGQQVELEPSQNQQWIDTVMNLQKVALPVDEGRLYQRLWLSLNQLHPLENNNFLYPTDISWDASYEYFSNTSQYKIINLDFITDADRDFLKTANFSIDNLQLMAIDNLAVEEIYINHFNRDENLCSLSKNHPKRSGFKWSILHPRHFQQSLVETGYIYTICPQSGQVIRSNQSVGYIQLAANVPLLIYRFQSFETFYLIVGGWSGGKIFAYFPQVDLIVHLCRDWSSWISTTTVINLFKADLVSQWRQVQAYITDNQPKKLAAVVGGVSNLGHYLWNDLSGLQFLKQNQLLHLVDRFLITENNRLEIGDIFNEIPSEKLIKPGDSKSVLKTILDSNYCAFRFTDSFIEEQLADNIYRAASKNCSQSFLSLVEQAKMNFPLIWINLRSQAKSWVSQVEGYANIICKLAEDYPNLGVIFDGVPTEKSYVEGIAALIPSSVSTYNAVDCSLNDTIVWANTIDLYIAVIGSGLTLVTWIANKPGVAHADRDHYPQINDFWLEVRENIIEPVLVPIDVIQDDPTDQRSGWRNYHCDWQEIYYPVLQVLQTLERKSSVIKEPPFNLSSLHPPDI